MRAAGDFCLAMSVCSLLVSERLHRTYGLSSLGFGFVGALLLVAAYLFYMTKDDDVGPPKECSANL